MAIAPDQAPSNQQKFPADNSSAFKPIAPITRPAIATEPENLENPFVALSLKQTGVEPLPAKKAKIFPPDVATLPPHNGPLPAQAPKAPANRPAKPVNFLLEDVAIAIAPEFMPAKPVPSAKTEMDFSLDYKNPEAEQLVRLSKEKVKDRACYKCGKQVRNGSLLNSTNGPACLRCYNPYFHRLRSNIFIGQEQEFRGYKVLVAMLHFFTAWIVPMVPAIIWYILLVRTGFGGFFEDCATILISPAASGLVFVLLLLAGLFFIPAGIASISLGETVAGSLMQISLKRLLTIIKSSMPGYFVLFFLLTATTILNLALIALCVEAGIGWASNVGAVLLAVGMSAVEMGVVRGAVGRGERNFSGKKILVRRHSTCFSNPAEPECRKTI